MKLTIPNIVREIRLSEFAPEFGEAKIYVWANPTRELRLSLIGLKLESTEEEMARIFSELWSAGPEGTQITPDEVLELSQSCLETTPALWEWIVVKTGEILREHWVSKKKVTP